MSSPGSVTRWIHQLKKGDRAAARPLWERYFRLLVERARRRLRGSPRWAADEEDVALSAFDRFYRAAEQGRFPKLDDRQDLWQLLVVLTDREAIDQRRRGAAARHGGGWVVAEGTLSPESSGEADSPLARLVSQDPSPEFAAQAAEELRRLLGLLADPELEQVALLKMEGYGAEEIAARLGCVPRTVQRRLRLIRHVWEKEVAP
jgi:RNA polymerase sigma factor (sigma-70 family)